MTIHQAHPCGQACPTTRHHHYTCTLPVGHPGPHQAWGFDSMQATWPNLSTIARLAQLINACPAHMPCAPCRRRTSALIDVAQAAQNLIDTMGRRDSRINGPNTVAGFSQYSSDAARILDAALVDLDNTMADICTTTDP